MLAAGALDAAFAQAGPFGAPRPKASPPAPAVGGVTGWLLAKQAEFYRALSGAIRAAKADGSAVWGLFTISFLYGVFHAAGPGHGKLVISSYLLANEETWWRGVVLSFASAMLQALVAVALVGVVAILLKAGRQAMCDTERVIEIVSYALIAAIGARLLWVKGRGFIATLRDMQRPKGALGAAATPRAAPRRPSSRSQSSSITIMITDTAMITRTTMAMRTTTTTRTTPPPGDTPMVPSRSSWPAPADGSAAFPPSSRSGCGHARARSWCWSSRWRRGCSGPAWLRPS